jgi:hypothetical protein
MCPNKDLSLSQHIAIPYIASNTVLAFLWFVVIYVKKYILR